MSTSNKKPSTSQIASTKESAGPGVIKMSKPLPPVAVHFLGTCSGGGPIISRQCSSLAVEFSNEIWLFDAADGTNNRLHQSPLKMSNITRIFITHMHADHVLGIVAILAVIMSGVGQTEAGLERLRNQGLEKKATIHLYGPVGLRELVRTILRITRISLNGVFAVHELIPEGQSPSTPCGLGDIHVNEAVGHDLAPDENGVWEVLQEGNGKGSKGWKVVAGPIKHRVDALGYVLTEPTPRLPLDTSTLIPILQSNAEALLALDPPIKHPLSLLSHLTSLPTPSPLHLPSGHVLHPPPPSGEPPRKLVIFGDCDGGTHNPYFSQLCADPSLLVHECTNGAIPELIAKGDKGAKVRASGLEQSLERKREGEFQNAAKERGEVGGRGKWGQHDYTEAERGGLSQDDMKKKEVREKAKSRGHSTPDEVGEFAKRINARRVVLNHFSAMFPSPRYPTCAPYPSLLSPVSPFLYPMPDHIRRPPPLPLTPEELHLRVIMQSLADQVTAIWHGDTVGNGGLSTTNESDPNFSTTSSKVVRGRTIPARDFMIIRIPSHELSAHEVEDVRRAGEEAERVMKSWKEESGVWVDDDVVNVNVDGVNSGNRDEELRSPHGVTERGRFGYGHRAKSDSGDVGRESSISGGGRSKGDEQSVSSGVGLGRRDRAQAKRWVGWTKKENR